MSHEAKALRFYPRVFLVGVVAVPLRQAEAMEVAAQAADGPTDRFINFAFTQTVHALASQWKVALDDGSIDWSQTRSHLVKVVSVGGGAN